jgi:hypothetical protein
MAINESMTKWKHSEPFALQVSRGHIRGHRTVIVFGFNPDVDKTESTVYPKQGILNQPATAIQMKISSTNSNDTSSGTGARTITIQGLDAEYNEIVETVILNGQNSVNTINLFIHINYMYVASAGSNKTAQGDIYIGTGTVTEGIPATVYNIIKYNYNNTITGCYTVPAGHTAYLSQGLFSAGQESGSTQVQGRLVYFSSDNIRKTAAITTLNNGVADYVFEYPLQILEKTTIEATAIGSANNNSVSSMFILVLIKNEGESL